MSRERERAKRIFEAAIGAKCVSPDPLYPLHRIDAIAREIQAAVDEARSELLASVDRVLDGELENPWSTMGELRSRIEALKSAPPATSGEPCDAEYRAAVDEGLEKAAVELDYNYWKLAARVRALKSAPPATSGEAAIEAAKRVGMLEWRHGVLSETVVNLRSHVAALEARLDLIAKAAGGGE